jgi:hypothetical protein
MDGFTHYHVLDAAQFFPEAATARHQENASHQEILEAIDKLRNDVKEVATMCKDIGTIKETTDIGLAMMRNMETRADNARDHEAVIHFKPLRKTVRGIDLLTE